jgi:hypothetical protein
LAGTGVWHYFDVELKSAVGHGAAVLKDEGAGAAMECGGDAFDGAISAGTLHRRVSGEHFAFAGCLEIAVELFVDGMRPSELSSVLKAGSRGAVFTSNVPVACWVMGESFCVVAGRGERESLLAAAKKTTKSKARKIVRALDDLDTDLFSRFWGSGSKSLSQPIADRGRGRGEKIRQVNQVAYPFI